MYVMHIDDFYMEKNVQLIYIDSSLSSKRENNFYFKKYSICLEY